ncbi:MAG TPA: DUF5054 domain-containing protein [Acidobacteriaceae bacterium]|nr:DUF5054 domain-containing protein [Acidobacteriaceae bacterium]
MQRRDFIKSVVAVGGASVLGQTKSFALQDPSYTPTPHLDVKRVLVMFKCHFDAGFVATQATVVDWYFSDYFPEAIRLASDQRRTGGPSYVWTTGSWLVYEYLEQASAQARRRMEDAITRGDIAWHALPFSWQTELMDPSMIAGSIGLSQALDKRFGRTTTGAKMTDVPGHTRGLVSPLAACGVNFLDIGVNGASMPAELPPLFLWKDANGSSLVVMYHLGYGGTVRVPGSDLAVVIEVANDNAGPHSPDEIVRIYSELGHRYPNADIHAASLTEIANAVEPYRNQLPVVTQEIGDTWIYGVSSDPLKVARYREVARLRQSWIAQKKFRIGDATDVALLRSVGLEAEHTWGTDTKTWLDYDHQTPQELAKMLDTKNYKVVAFSWEEKRKDLFDGIGRLPAPLRSQAEEAVRNLQPKEPQLAAGAVIAASQEIENTHFILQLDPKTGAIHRLRSKKTGREWASPDHPLALFSYQTLSQQDYSEYRAKYLVMQASWAQFDFGKPGIERFGARNQEWQPSLVDLRSQKDAQGQHLLARLEIRDPEAQRSGRTAFPQKLYMEWFLPDAEPAIHLNFYAFQKPATRLPESLWLTFNPVVSDPKGWMLEKSGEQVSPFDVVRGGSRQMHAISTHFSYKDDKGSFVVEPIDSPLVAMGSKSPLNFSKDQPGLSSGMHVNLFNNAWGTNYIMWYGEDMRSRFVLRA